MRKTRYFMFVADLEELPLCGFPCREITEAEYNLLLPYTVETCEADDVRNGDLLMLLLFVLTTPDIQECVRLELEQVLLSEHDHDKHRPPKHGGKLN